MTEHDIWTKRDPKGPDYDFGAAPQLWDAVIDGVQRQLVGAGQKSGIFYVCDRVTGEKLWTHTVGYGQIGGGTHGEGTHGEGSVGAAEPNGVFAYSIYADGPRAAAGDPPMERQPLQVRKDDGR